MTRRFYILGAGLLLTLFFFTGNATAFAATKQKSTVAQASAAGPVEKAAVNLYCRLKAGSKTFSASGSGVFISERGVILTNAHVAQYFLLLSTEKSRIRGSCTVRTGSPAKDRYTASVLYIPPTWLEENAFQISSARAKGTGKDDFALLYVTGAKKGSLPERFPALPLGVLAPIEEGAPVTLGGYPTEGLSFDKIRSKLAYVQAAVSVENIQSFSVGNASDYLTLSASKAGRSGASGGPVVNDSNTLIAIVSGKSTAKVDPGVRALTLSYIDRALRLQTRQSLEGILAENFPLRAQITAALLPLDALKTLTYEFFKMGR